MPARARPSLFSEELGAVIQVRKSDVAARARGLRRFGRAHPQSIGRPIAGSRIVIRRGDHPLFEDTRANLRRVWSETTFAMQALRDDPTCAHEEQESPLRRE